MSFHDTSSKPLPSPWGGQEGKYWERKLAPAPAPAPNNPAPVRDEPPSLKERCISEIVQMGPTYAKIALFALLFLGGVGFGLASIGAISMTLGMIIVPIAATAITLTILTAFLATVPSAY